MEFFKPASETAAHVKVLEMGDSNSGKTWDSFYLPGPMAGFEVEAGLIAYRDRFPFDIMKAKTVQELNEILKNLTGTEQGRAALDQYSTIAFDGISRLWQDEIARLQGGTGEIKFEDMGALKSPWKALNSHIKMLGLLDKNVIATAHSKIDWDIPENGTPVPKGVKGDFDDRLFEAFDLVLYREVEKDEDGNDHYTALVVKSRYGHLKLGQKIQDWNPEEQFARIFEGLNRTPAATPATRASTGDAPTTPVPSPEPESLVSAAAGQNVTTAQQNEIRTLCQTHGSKGKGGTLDDALVREAMPFLGGTGTRADADALLGRLRAAVSEAEPATATAV